MLSTAVLLAASITLGQGAEATPMPADVRKQLDENVIGEWTLKATHGEATITGEETWTWSSDNVCLVFRGSLVVDGKKATYGGVMGWDGTERALVSHMFTSDGDIGMTRWKQLGPSQWNGTWSGTYQGQRTETPAKIEFKKEFTRYEDTTNGKPWVSIATRNAKKTPPSKL